MSKQTWNIFWSEFHQDRWETFQSSKRCQFFWQVSRWRTEGWPSGSQHHQKVGEELSLRTWRLDAHFLRWLPPTGRSQGKIVNEDVYRDLVEHFSFKFESIPRPDMLQGIDNLLAVRVLLVAELEKTKN